MKKLLIISALLFSILSVNAQVNKNLLLALVNNTQQQDKSSQIDTLKIIQHFCPDTTLKCYILVTTGNNKYIKCIYGYVNIDICTGIEKYYDDKKHLLKDNVNVLKYISR